ncbi:MAG: GNAT family protein [Pseudomonadales bacterium]|jgi:RimJ/RimL family protein N-acetyltransferase|nr:GNAT family protein [Pseudomonadales bacterium]
MTPLPTTIQIPGPDGTWIDLLARRSRGPLTPAEHTLVRGLPVSLSYDPVQEGWLPAGVFDDLVTDTTNDRPDSRLAIVCRTLLEAAAVAALARIEQRDAQPEQVVEELWELANTLVSRYGHASDPSRQLEAHEATQLRAAEIVGTWLTSRPVLQERRDRLARTHSGYRLRPWSTDDAPRFVELLDDPRVWEHLPEAYPDPLTEEMARNLIEISNRGEHHIVRAIERNGAVVGQIRLSRQGAHVRPFVDAEISYWLGVPYWGQGIASDVIPLFTSQCFEQTRVQSIFARVADANTASGRALEKSGYHYLGAHYSELKQEPEMRTYRSFRAEWALLDAQHRVPGAAGGAEGTLAETFGGIRAASRA